MILSEKQLVEMYPNVSSYSDIFYRDPVDEEDFVTNFLTSKLWRLDNLYKIVNKKGKLIRFELNYAQHMVFSALQIHPRLIILKSRQQGISTLWLISYFDDGLTLSNKNIGLMAQGNEEGYKLLERLKLLWDEFDPDILTLWGVYKLKDNSKELSLSNNSKIYVRNSFRSTTLHRVHISELGKIAAKDPKKVKEVKSGTLQAVAPGNVAVIESTAEGENEFKKMWDKAIIAKDSGTMSAKDFYPVFLSWVHDPDCVEPVQQSISIKQAKYFDELEAKLNVKLSQEQKNFWVSEYREVEEDIYQEYPATATEAFQSAKDGTYYSSLYTIHVIKKDKEINGLYDPALLVNVMFDFGMNDTFVLIFFQIFENSIRIIDEYTNSGEGLQHYVNIIDDAANDKGYQYDEYVLPHDAAVRNLDAEGKTREAILYDLGLVDQITQGKTSSIQDDIELVRANLHRIHIDTSCTYVRDCFLKYTKEWDDRHSVWKNKPVHDEYSHGADCIRGIVKYAPTDTKIVQKFSTNYITNESGFAV